MKAIILYKCKTIGVLFLALMVFSFFQPQKEKVTKVYSAQDLQIALDNANPGETILLDETLFVGKFKVKAGINGTKAKPIVLIGAPKSILQTKEPNSGYALWLEGNEYWHIKGFTIQNSKKGLVLDRCRYNTVENLTVNNIGEEAIHFRTHSSYNILKGSTVTNTGLLNPSYGEACYLGTAISNWDKISEGKPDTSNYNIIEGNTFGPYVAAEGVDVKEGTTGNIITGNTFYGKGQKGENGGDSWMDVKGSFTLIENNKGYDALIDGFQVHIKGEGFGENNIFRNNYCEVNSSGMGFYIQQKNGTANGNIVYDNNVVKNAAKGVSNISITSTKK